MQGQPRGGPGDHGAAHAIDERDIPRDAARPARDFMAGYIARGKDAGLPVTALEQLMASLPHAIDKLEASAGAAAEPRG
jgi:hypothetical protein